MYVDITDIDLFDQIVGMVCTKVNTQMLMDIIDIDLFNQNMSITCTKVRLRYSWISVVLIYLIQICIKVRLRCSWISVVLIYLIQMWVWHMPKLDSDIHGYHWY